MARLIATAAIRKSTPLTSANVVIAPGETRPAGISRPAVRGFSASSRRSRTRLSAMAAFRPVTMQTRINPRVRPGGHAPPVASIMAVNAMGSANSVWASLMSLKIPASAIETPE